MRQLIIEAGQSIYTYMKSPLGLAVTTGVAASTTQYFFGKTQLSQELTQAQKEKKQLEETVMKLSHQHHDISLINMEHQAKNDALRDELTHAKEHLQDCNNQLANRNCFFCYSEFKNSKLSNCIDNNKMFNK